jgi:hypothetical protein
VGEAPKKAASVVLGADAGWGGFCGIVGMGGHGGMEKETGEGPGEAVFLIFTGC